MITVHDPARGEIVGEVAELDDGDIAAMVTRARAAQPAWEQLGFAGRAEVMHAMRRWFVRNREELVEICVAESGRLRDDVTFVEILYPCDAMAFWARRAEAYLRDERVRPHSPFIRGRRVRIRNKPHGVVGVIAPWNFPVGLGFGDGIPALMAGNALIVKPSEVTPLSSLLIERGWQEIGAPADVLQIATGGGETGAALVDQVDMVHFTGSGATGRKVAVRAAERLIPVSLELGGKDPMIVLADADVDRAAGVAVRMGFFNAGQACVCIERVYVESAVYDEFVARVIKRAAAVRYGVPGAPGSLEYGAIIHPPQVDVIERHIADAVRKGATVRTGGKRVEINGGTFFEPTVLTEVTHDMDVMRDETFGPVLPIMRVDSAREASRLANDSAYGLAASVMTTDLRRGERLGEGIEAGSVCVNDAVINGFVLEAPFGGSKGSGLGGRHGRRGIEKFCEKQTMVVTSRWAGKLDDRMGWPNRIGRAKLLDRLLPVVFGRR